MSTLSITVQDQVLRILAHSDQGNYISLTDMANGFEGGTELINRWLRSIKTINFLSDWERLNNQNFKSNEILKLKEAAKTNNFKLSIKEWREKFKGIGIITKLGRYGGTYAHPTIAKEFHAWGLYRRNNVSSQVTFSKLQYKIHNIHYLETLGFIEMSGKSIQKIPGIYAVWAKNKTCKFGKSINLYTRISKYASDYFAGAKIYFVVVNNIDDVEKAILRHCQMNFKQLHTEIFAKLTYEDLMEVLSLCEKLDQ